MVHDWRIEAGRIWPVLVDVASRREVMTYKDLGTRSGVFYRNLRHPLDRIGRYCFERAVPRLPPLTILIINGDTRRPGDGIVGTHADRFDEDRDRVFDFAWSTVVNPFAVFATTR